MAVAQVQHHELSVVFRVIDRQAFPQAQVLRKEKIEIKPDPPQKQEQPQPAEAAKLRVQELIQQPKRR